jgi:thiol:disulfide interchange protein DsbD
MLWHRRRPGLVLALAALAGPWALAHAGGFLEGGGLSGLVEAPAQGNFQVSLRIEPARQAAGGRATAWLDFRCQPHYYVWHESVKVALDAAAADGVTIAAVRLPEPREKYDAFAERTVRYLDGSFSAAVVLQVAPEAKAGDRQLAFDLRYTGCGPDVCQFGRARLTGTLTVLPAGSAQAPAPAAGADGTFAGRSALAAVLLAFLTGLGLTFTPCVYPLIPVTVSLVGATAGRTRLDGLVRSLVYVFGISLTYSLAGVVAAMTGGVFGQWLQLPAVYLALAVLFAVLAGGMFELYSIDLSSQRLYRLQAALRGKLGLAGIGLIGLLSGAAATACIAPVIVWALTYVAQRGSPALGFLVFFSMAWGMGTPLVVVGTFAGAAQALPRPGEWMVVVKRMFGLALLGAAVYYVGKSRLMPQAWYLALVGAFLLGAGVFVGAFDRLEPRSGRWVRLKKAAGLLLVAASVVAFLRAGGVLAGARTAAPEVEWLGSEQAAVARAEAEGKPLLLDFWADWCEPCHRMLEVTFRDPRVVEESRRFACAKVDVGDPDDAAVQDVRRRYGVQGVPTVVLVGTDATRHAHAGYIGPDEMLIIVQSVR